MAVILVHTESSDRSEVFYTLRFSNTYLDVRVHTNKIFFTTPMVSLNAIFLGFHTRHTTPLLRLGSHYIFGVAHSHLAA